MTVFIPIYIDRLYRNNKIALSDKVLTRMARVDEVPTLIESQMLDTKGIQTATGYGNDTTRRGEVETMIVRTLVLEGD